MNAYAMQSEPHAHVVLSLIHCNYIKTSDQDLEETLPQNTDRYIYIPPIHLDHTGTDHRRCHLCSTPPQRTYVARLRSSQQDNITLNSYLYLLRTAMDLTTLLFSPLLA